MRDGDFRGMTARLSGTLRRLALCTLSLTACGKAAAPPSKSPAAEAPPVAAPSTGCPANGQWAACSVLYRLERAGLAPKVDSSGKPSEKQLGGAPMMIKIGMSAELEVHLFADSLARAAAVANLDRTQFVNGTAQQTIRRERTLIESVNLVGLLTSINAHQRERVSDALTAGPPQPP
jgi:hypothetical protein